MSLEGDLWEPHNTFVVSGSFVDLKKQIIEENLVNRGNEKIIRKRQPRKLLKPDWH
jgi:hypothetical protein